MLKKLFLIIFICSCFTISCETKQEIDPNFLDTYKEILLTRAITLDSLNANKQVAEILAKHGFSNQSFSQEFMKYAKEKNTFVTMIDSLRNIVDLEVQKLDRKPTQETNEKND